MKLLVLCMILAVSQAAPYSELLNEEWSNFKLQHSKTYSSLKEEELRMKIFMENKQEITKHNEAFKKGEVTYEREINKFADMSKEEIASMVRGARFNRQTRGTEDQVYKRQRNLDVPKSIDWRKKGAVTPVKNQGDCRGSWAFSATGALEGQHFRKTGKLVSLSEQNLIDCSTSYGNKGCSSGNMVAAFKYVIANKGDDTEASYPFEGKDLTCRYNAKNIGATATSYVTLPEEDQDALKEVVATLGPVSALMDASLYSFMSYKSGIYYDPDCSSDSYDTTDGVLVVGYGSSNGTNYWIVKNSWGADWGENGYAKISFFNNICGIASFASYPVV